jgi:hypothetical protein
VTSQHDLRGSHALIEVGRSTLVTWRTPFLDRNFQVRRTGVHLPADSLIIGLPVACPSPIPKNQNSQWMYEQTLDLD